MTVNVIANITQGHIGPADNTTSPDNTYYVGFTYSVTDGTTASEGSDQVLISVSSGAKKANRTIRERIASAVLAAHSLTIDPEDIYIPFS